MISGCGLIGGLGDGRSLPQLADDFQLQSITVSS